MKRALIIVLVLASIGGAAWCSTRERPVAVRVAAVERGMVRATVSNTRVGTVEICRRAKMSPVAPIVRMLMTSGLGVRYVAQALRAKYEQYRDHAEKGQAGAEAVRDVVEHAEADRAEHAAELRRREE